MPGGENSPVLTTEASSHTIPVLFVLFQGVALPMFLVVGAGIGILLLIVIIWSIRRRVDPDFRIETPPERFVLARESITGLTHGRCVSGNEVKLLENGDGFFPALFSDIDGAEQSVHFESYLWKPGELSDRLTKHLVSAAGRGVAVRVLLDGTGGKISDEQKERLTTAGAEVHLFRPLNLANIGRMNSRDHRKIAVIDGCTGYVGGHCIVDTWLGNAEDKEHFRDISVRVRGPVVNDIQAAFSENWIEATSRLFFGSSCFPRLEAEGDCDVHIARVKPSGVISSVKLLHHVVIECARERILIQNPYFLPDPPAIDSLRRAVERGVDVQIMIPSVGATDNALVQHASHHRFGALLKHGIRIHEYNKTLLHQKVMSVDGVWAAVGSTNFDDRSFEINDEITLGIWSESLAGKLERIFDKDLEHCTEISLEKWKSRGILHKLKDQTFFLVNEQL